VIGPNLIKKKLTAFFNMHSFERKKNELLEMP
jgi:hypothetical protein